MVPRRITEHMNTAEGKVLREDVSPDVFPVMRAIMSGLQESALLAVGQAGDNTWRKIGITWPSGSSAALSRSRLAVGLKVVTIEHPPGGETVKTTTVLSSDGDGGSAFEVAGDWPRHFVEGISRCAGDEAVFGLAERMARGVAPILDETVTVTLLTNVD